MNRIFEYEKGYVTFYVSSLVDSVERVSKMRRCIETIYLMIDLCQSLEPHLPEHLSKTFEQDGKKRQRFVDLIFDRKIRRLRKEIGIDVLSKKVRGRTMAGTVEFLTKEEGREVVYYKTPEDVFFLTRRRMRDDVDFVFLT